MSDKYPDNNPKSIQGMEKVNLFLVPPVAIAHEARAMEDGARKYGPYNWRGNSVAASVYLAAAKRHIDSWLDGEENAADSGVHHLGHARACLGILLDALETGNLIDDRPSKGAASAVFSRYITDDTKKALAAETDIDIVPEPNEKPIGFLSARPGGVPECKFCAHRRVAGSEEPCYSCIDEDDKPNWEPRV